MLNVLCFQLLVAASSRQNAAFSSLDDSCIQCGPMAVFDLLRLMSLAKVHACTDKLGVCRDQHLWANSRTDDVVSLNLTILLREGLNV